MISIIRRSAAIPSFDQLPELKSVFSSDRTGQAAIKFANYTVLYPESDSMVPVTCFFY